MDKIILSYELDNVLVYIYIFYSYIFIYYGKRKNYLIITSILTMEACRVEVFDNNLLNITWRILIWNEWVKDKKKNNVYIYICVYTNYYIIRNIYILPVIFI